MRNQLEHEETPYDQDVELEVTLENAQKLSELSKTANKLYLYIREESFRSKGLIFFDKKEAKLSCGFKQNKSIYNALNELINKDILAGTKDASEFYYNPKFIYHEKE